jgi:type IV pilus assembly protein PilA
MKTELKAKFIQQILSKKKDSEGFTLIELLVVIIIIGILSAIALPSFINQAAKAKQTEAKSTISAFNRAQQTQRIESGLFANSITSLSIGLTTTSTNNYDYSQSAGTMQHTMTIRYETVKYLNGGLGGGAGKPDSNIGWPDTAHYDTQKSPLARAGSTASIFGQGGLLSTGEGILADLESGSVAGLIGAAQKAGAAYNTFKGKNLKSIVQSEATSLGKQVIGQSLPGATRTVINKADGWIFPNAARNQTNNTPPI